MRNGKPEEMIDLKTGEVISSTDGKLFFDLKGNVYYLLSDCYVQDVKTGDVHLTSGYRGDRGRKT